MAAGRIDRPGTGRGPCDPECSHPDCTALRRIAEMACTHCGEPIGYDRRFLNLRDEDLTHEDCLLESLKRRDADGDPSAQVRSNQRKPA